MIPGPMTIFAPSNLKEATVLVVEDEQLSRRALTTLLLKSGYRVLAAESAEEALKLNLDLAETIIALVDFNLPAMDGLELIRRLESTYLNVQSMLITATGQDDIRELARRQSIAFLPKPINIRQLLSFVGEHTPHN
jgi:CheY-like chemotaxis protein